MKMAQQKFPFLSVTIFLSLLFTGHFAVYDSEGTGVQILTESDFENKVLNGNEPWLIGFGGYSHTTRRGSFFKDTGDLVKNIIHVGAVDPRTARKHGITSFVTVKIYLGNGETPITVASRKASDIEAFVRSHLLYRVKKSGKKSKVTILKKKEFQRRVMDRGERWLINFSDKFNSSCRDFEPAYEHTARMLQGQINVGVVFDTEFAKTQHSSPIVVRSFPTMILYSGVTVYPDVRGTPVLYTGPKDSRSLSAFVKAGTPASSVRVLEPEDFSREVITSDESSWLISFCPMTAQSQPTCQGFASTLEQVAQRLKGFVNVGTFMEPILTEGVTAQSEYPVLQLYVGTRKTATLYTGTKDAQPLYEFVRGHSSLSGIWCK